MTTKHRTILSSAKVGSVPAKSARKAVLWVKTSVMSSKVKDAFAEDGVLFAKTGLSSGKRVLPVRRFGGKRVLVSKHGATLFGAKKG